jgi:hydrogenase maturation protein HypF
VGLESTKNLVDRPRDCSKLQSKTRLRLQVRGVVQGVGFRPYVYRLARSLGLAGFVLNDIRGVTIEVEGDEASTRAFTTRLPSEIPPLARCDGIATETIGVAGDFAFHIVARKHTTPNASDAFSLIAPDAATCDECLTELLDADNRRYRYPFINCTDCGPRFTIVRAIPYDRENTTMNGFAMCDACAAEYHDPLDRRFHAQPNACAVCGPRVRLTDEHGVEMFPAVDDSRDAIARAAAMLTSGAIVAVKGIGGYHLTCVASNPGAVAQLRARKHRPDKPFALMVADANAAARLVDVNADECALLESTARPIVLLPMRWDADPTRVASGVAPRHRELGIMLPYSPLHHLLVRQVGEPLVMTSGNLSDEPLAFDDSDALRRLAGIADAFLVHDRPIERPVDDSVMRVVRIGGVTKRLTVRRSRGYAPTTLPLPALLQTPTLACGAQLKNTYALGAGRSALLSPYLGDLDGYETFAAFRDGIAADEQRFGLRVGAIIADAHPSYQSTSYARERAEREGRDFHAVQHHHAHFAACLAEHGIVGDAIGVIFDGTGLGEDSQGGGIWGGEILVGNVVASRRVAHLNPVALPGGDAAVREPWRMACAWLCAVDPSLAAHVPARLAHRVDAKSWSRVRQICMTHEGSIIAPQTTSVGRLFDAVAALCGIAPRSTYEGQAAVELEACARGVDGEMRQQYAMSIVEDAHSSRLMLDARGLVRDVVGDLERGVSIAKISLGVHGALANTVVRACELLEPTAVTLSGGAFQNVVLLEQTAALLHAAGKRVFMPERLPVNDGGVSYGQLATYAARRAFEKSASARAE